MSRKKSTGEKEFAVMRFTFILPENIVENKLNNAVINNIDYLKESIRQNGLRQPIDVLPEKNGTTYRIIGGHRRFAAIKRKDMDGFQKGSHVLSSHTRLKTQSMSRSSCMRRT